MSLNQTISRKIDDLLRWKARHRVFSWSSYSKWVEEIHQDKSQFVSMTEHPFQRQPNDAKIFAYYLTQYHAIPENDIAHGKGFTEWINVATAQPHFVGHYQPKIPYDLGFYNLLMPGVMERQVEIAKTYGIYGFCFYYYWFSGKKVLEKPLLYWLAHQEIDFHYHFCWADENWSKLWDGGNKEIILKQGLQDGDAEQLFADLLPFFQDKRYEKIDNKPIFMIYRPSVFPNEDFLLFIDKLQSLARKNNFNGLYLTCSPYGDNNPLEWGMDAMTEFPPHGLWDLCPEIRTINRLVPSTNFAVRDTTKFIKNKMYLQNVNYPVFKCCFPSWDNTPRKAWTNGSYFNLSYEHFAIWLTDIIQWTKINHKINEQYVYINAWNEWGEGAILEPTFRYGYKALDIVKQCLERVR